MAGIRTGSGSDRVAPDTKKLHCVVFIIVLLRKLYPVATAPGSDTACRLKNQDENSEHVIVVSLCEQLIGESYVLPEMWLYSKRPAEIL